jgi:hypothetical protein
LSTPCRYEVDAAGLLEVGELGDLHAVEPDLPAEAPGAQGRRFPVVLDEADVVLFRIDAEAAQRVEIELEDVLRRGLHDHLELVVVLQAIGILAVAAVGGAAGGFDVGDVPGLGAEHPQEGGGVEGAGPLLHVVGLLDDAALFGPIVLQGKDQVLKGHDASGQE